MNARKVLEMGGGTLLVSLPKDWARKNGVKKGGILDVSELSGRKLMVSPIGEADDEPKEFVVEYPGEGMNQVTNEITGAYLLGYNVIRIVGKKTITREDRAQLRTTLGRLVGLEIMDEDSKRVAVQFLLESSAIVPEKIVRRMSGLLEGMLRDAAEALVKGDAKLFALVSERDDEVDRLYFLLVRATRAAVTRPDVAEGYGLTPVDLLDYRVLASFLESVGDGITELSRKLHAQGGPKDFRRDLASVLLKVTEMNELATKAFISRRAAKPANINQRVNALAEEVSVGLGRLAKGPTEESAAVAEVLGSVDRVTKLLVDVSDLAVIAQPVAQ